MTHSETLRMAMLDQEYQLGTISKVEQEGDGLTITWDGWAIHTRRDFPGPMPRVGDLALCYGKGVGYTVRGIVIAPQLGERYVLRYRSAAEQAALDVPEREAIRQKHDAMDAEERAKPRPALPRMAFKDDKARATWADCIAKNDDAYGAAAIRYANAFVEALDAAVGHDASLEEGAAWLKANAAQVDTLSHEADTEGITGHMAGFAHRMIVRCWAHGEALRGVL